MFPHQQIVTNAIRNLPQSVGIQWRNDKQVCPAPQLDVQHGVRALLPELNEKQDIWQANSKTLISSLLLWGGHVTSAVHNIYSS